MFVLSVAAAVILLAGFNMLREPPRTSLPGAVLLCCALLATSYPIFRLERLFDRLPAADKAASEILTYLDRQPRIGQMPAAVKLERLSRQISLERVTLADMTGRLLLDNISCQLPAGRPVVLFSTDETTALALAGLLPRFCDPAAGQVLFDGRDLRLATLDSVRRQVALILSDHILTSGTLAQNIAGDAGDYTQDEIVAAVKHVHADEFVQSLADGLQTMVGAHGQALSTGQAISVGLARVALHPAARDDNRRAGKVKGFHAQSISARARKKPSGLVAGLGTLNAAAPAYLRFPRRHLFRIRKADQVPVSAILISNRFRRAISST